MSMDATKYSVEPFFDESSSTFSYLLVDLCTLDCALIDPLLDFDPGSGRTDTTSADRIATRVLELGATVKWLLETHVHADHLSAASYLKARLGGRIGIGAHVTEVQSIFKSIFNAGYAFTPDGVQFDALLIDGQTLRVGDLRVTVIGTPGHTPACVTYVVEGTVSCAFVGDTLFMPDYGTARCDFPGGDARTLYRSIMKLLNLPLETSLFTCHDYRPGGRPLAYRSTVAQQRENIHLAGDVCEDAFVRMREARDCELPMPRLMLPAVQINMRAGSLPEPEDNGVSYLKIPINSL